MNDLVFENIFRSNEVSFNDDGIAICPYCVGTGLNAEFELLNEYHEIIEFPLSAHCLKCYGKKRVDWIEFANGRIDNELDYLFHEILETPSNAFLQFLSFVYDGYRYQINDEENCQYDNRKKKWFVSTLNDWSGHVESKKEMLIWIKKLICAGYLRDSESPQEFSNKSFPSVDIANVYSHYYDPECDYECAAEIKSEILNATEMKIEDLLRIKEDLKILGYSIGYLNNIESYDESEKIFEVDFEFTWENLLDKFKLPSGHKYSPVAKGVLTFD